CARSSLYGSSNDHALDYW
nr:immunoglobulin heavy chain junction region [Mus musculus]